MKRTLAGFLAGALLATTGVAVGGGNARHGGAVKLKAGQAITFAGLTCSTYDGTRATNANIVCVRNNLRGYGVVVSQEQVIVAKRVNNKVKVFFKRPNR